MVIELLIVWVLGVAAFFALWALIAWIFRKISERKGDKKPNEEKSCQS